MSQKRGHVFIVAPKHAMLDTGNDQLVGLRSNSVNTENRICAGAR
jgi:hypothetical protein